MCTTYFLVFSYLSLLLSALQPVAVVASCALSQRYARGPLRLGTDAELYYSLNWSAKKISFGLVINSSVLRDVSRPAWMGLGVSERTSGSMLGADIASVNFNSDVIDKCKLTDRFVPWAAFPLGKSTRNATRVFPYPDKCQHDDSWKLLACKRNAQKGALIMEVERKLAANDAQDRAITHGPQQLIYAYGAGEFGYHGKRRGGSRVILFDKNGNMPVLKKDSTNEPPLPSDVVKVHDVVATNYSVPHERVTTYACTSSVVQIPKGKSLALVAVDPVINAVSGGASKVHHLIISACKKNPVLKAYEQTNVCRGTEMDCTGFTYAWAVGVGRFVLPDNVGMVINEHNRYLVLQTHYDNNNLDKNVVDASGVRLYFAQNRRVKAGTLVLGDMALSLLGRKVKHNFEYESTCPSECTRKFKNTLNVFGSFLHMHTTGRKIWTNRFSESGKFIENLNAVEYWSNDHQLTQTFSPPKKINPGDKLSTTCIYDTRKAAGTKFGYETKDEMCADFVYYYPMQKIHNTDGSMLGCGIYYPRKQANSTTAPRAITRCGDALKSSSNTNIPNPTFRDTVDTPDLFGRRPGTCARLKIDAPNNTQLNKPQGKTAAKRNANAAEDACFPAEVTVLLQNGTRKKMGEIQLGDVVHVGNGIFSEVFMFSHRKLHSMHEFVRVTGKDFELFASASHLIYVKERNGVLTAAEIRAGMNVVDARTGGNLAVTKVEHGVPKMGLFNPQTLHGDIEVNGVLASCYTSAVHEVAAHALLAPIRAAAMWSEMHTHLLENGAPQWRLWTSARGILARK